MPTVATGLCGQQQSFASNSKDIRLRLLWLQKTTSNGLNKRNNNNNNSSSADDKRTSESSSSSSSLETQRCRLPLLWLLLFTRETEEPRETSGVHHQQPPLIRESSFLKEEEGRNLKVEFVFSGVLGSERSLFHACFIYWASFLRACWDFVPCVAVE